MQSAFRFALLAALVAIASCSDPIDRVLNPVSTGKLVEGPGAAEMMRHWSLFIADLHADTLATDRDFFTPGQTAGHVDLPRLKAGNIGLQAFTVFTDTPFPREDGCVDDSDTNFAAVLQAIQWRPRRIWTSQMQNALFQAQRLRELRNQSLERVASGTGEAVLLQIRDAGDVKLLVEKRRAGEPVIGALLGLEGDIRNLDVLFGADFRMIAPTHRFHNQLSGASEGCGPAYPLTFHGRDVLAAAARRRMVIDLAHASSPTIREVSEMAIKGGFPVIISHGGVFGTCAAAPNASVARNATDDDIRAVARTGGVIGIGYWPEAVCWKQEDSQQQRVGAIVRAMAHAYRTLQDEAFATEMRARNPDYDPGDHIAFGSDYDGAVTVPFDAAGMALLTAAMQRDPDSGRPLFDDRTIRKIAGANVCRVLATQLDGGSPAFARTVCNPLLESPFTSQAATRVDASAASRL